MTRYIKRDRNRLYLRRAGMKPVRLYSMEGTPEFAQEYEQALHRMTAAAPSVEMGSFQWLLKKYFASPEFLYLMPRTQKVRRRILERVCEIKTRADAAYRQLLPRHVRDMRDELSSTPEAANGRVKALRQVFKWAIERDLADHNPAASVPYFPPANPGGFHTWTEDEVERYEERHPIGTKARLALVLLLYTGVRRGDVVRLGPQMEREGCLIFTEEKNAGRAPKERCLPILPELRRAIDAAKSGHLAYLVTQFGKPFSAPGFGNWFRRRCNEAGLTGCSAHGLRKAGAVRAAEAGATTKQLMAIFGWRSAKMADRYTLEADKTKLVMQSMHLLERKSVAITTEVSHRQ